MVNEADKETKKSRDKLIFSDIHGLFQNYWSMQMDLMDFFLKCK